ncbi:MAG: Flagellin protein FlaA, partial [uncultured Blastococcus sp.]
WSSSPGTRSSPRPAPRCSRRPTRPRRVSCPCSA